MRLIKTDGTIEEISDITFEDLQKLVGGYVEILRCGDKIYAMDEDAKMKNVPINTVATDLLNDRGAGCISVYDAVRGPVVEMNQTEAKPVLG